MSIETAHIIWRYPQVRNDTTANGGRMTATAIPDTKNSVFPDISQAERTAGSTKYRKVFIHIANPDNLGYINPKFFLETVTPGEDRVTIFQGTQTDTQNTITGSERQFGGGKLNANANSGATTIDVLVEAATDDIFQNGDTIRISNKTTVTAAGDEQFVAISGVPTYAGDVATITLATALEYNFLASNTRVASIVEPADIKGSYDTFVVTAAGSGAYDDTTFPIIVPSRGGIEQDWTLEFTSSTEFSIIGDTLGVLGTGATGSNTQPNNLSFSSPYFILDFNGFSGVFAAGDTLTFTTHPASVGLWYKRVVPAGASALSANSFIIGTIGESE